MSSYSVSSLSESHDESEELEPSEESPSSSKESSDRFLFLLVTSSVSLGTCLPFPSDFWPLRSAPAMRKRARRTLVRMSSPTVSNSYSVQIQNQKLLNQFGAHAQPLGSQQAGELRKGLCARQTSFLKVSPHSQRNGDCSSIQWVKRKPPKESQKRPTPRGYVCPARARCVPGALTYSPRGSMVGND